MSSNSPHDLTVFWTFRTFEHESDVGLFLFSDALVLTRKSVQHTPFTLTRRNTHTFMASVALSSLTVREILHTRCEFLSHHVVLLLHSWKFLLLTGFLKFLSRADVCHAFILEGPCRFWVCATERGQDRKRFLPVLRSAIKSALTGHWGWSTCKAKMVWEEKLRLQ